MTCKRRRSNLRLTCGTVALWCSWHCRDCKQYIAVFMLCALYSAHCPLSFVLRAYTEIDRRYSANSK
jgi:hypothetical protein